MSQRGIGDLPKPPLRYRVDLGDNARLSGFETITKSREEDLLRAKRICQAVAADPAGFDLKRTLLLAAMLRAAGEGGDAPQSLASSVYMRGLRINIAGALWRLIQESNQ
jgi:hypothetical protein